MDLLEKQVKLGCVSAVLEDEIKKRLFGEILTIVDASVYDLQSRKAVKSLISQSFTRVTSQVLNRLNSLGGE